MAKHKIGEIVPFISMDQALLSHDECNCTNPYLVKKPLRRIEFMNMFTFRNFSEDCWTCLTCKWESEPMKKRTS